MSTTPLPSRITVVGGGLAGFTAVSELRSRGYDGALTLLDPEGIPYDRPPLSKDFMLGAVDETQIRLTDAGWFETNSVELVEARATGLSTARGVVQLDSGDEISSDAVVITVGGVVNRLNVPGASEESVHVLRDLEHALALRAVLTPGVRILIIGAGLIGAETASTALALGAEVTLVDPSPLPLAKAVGPLVAEVLHAEHTKRGIRTVAAGVSEIEGDGPYRATLTSGETVEVDVILAGVGSKANTALAETAGLATNSGILVDEFGRTSNPSVFAAGDAARQVLDDGTLLRRAEHWEAAQKSGAAVAAAILGQDAPKETPEWFWSDRHGAHVEVVGSLDGDGETVIRGSLGEPPAVLFHVADGKVRGAVSINDSTAVRAAKRLIADQIPVDPANLADPTINLKKLVRA